MARGHGLASAAARGLGGRDATFCPLRALRAHFLARVAQCRYAKENAIPDEPNPQNEIRPATGDGCQACGTPPGGDHPNRCPCRGFGRVLGVVIAILALAALAKTTLWPAADPLAGYPEAIVQAIKEGKTLEEVDLKRTDIADLAPLAAMKSLKKLDLTRTAITDLAPLRALPLKSLSLGGCEKIADLAPLQGMKTLEAIELKGTKFKGTPLKEIVGE